jgi:hypothetical protein
MTCKEEMLRNQAWEALKKDGSDHYKTAGVEPIDLYRAMGLFRPWAIVEICQHALRNRLDDAPVSSKDMDKIIDYARKLDAAYGDGIKE